MNWYYEAAGQQQGPISDSELDRLLAEGKITPDTLVWREGLPAWTPLRSTRAASDRPVAPAPSAGYPAAPAGASTPPGDVPAGYIRCSLTGKYFPPSEIIYIEGRPYSAEAKPQVLQSLQSGEALPGNDAERNGPPWEQRLQLGFVKAFWGTITGVLRQPTGTFSTMRREGGLWAPLLFMMLGEGIPAMISQIYGLLFQTFFKGIAGAAAAGQAGAQTNPAFRLNAAFGMSTAMQIGLLVAMPFIIVIGTFLYAGVVHLALKLFGGANRRFEATMRAICYVSGASGVFYLVPFCGAYVAGIWALVALCIGLGRVHDTSTEKGLGAALLSTLVCCGVYLGAFGVFFAMVMGAMGAFNGLGR